MSVKICVVNKSLEQYYLSYSFENAYDIQDVVVVINDVIKLGWAGHDTETLVFYTYRKNYSGLSFQNYTRYDDPSKRLHNEIWFG
jgi:hypothetical protein